MATISKSTLTAAEYLAMERASDSRHELIDGEAIDVTGAPCAHNRIVLNIGGSLNVQLAGHAGEPYVNDMRVRCGDSYVYPDVVVVRDEPVLEDERFDTLLNPAVVFEVLSPTTEAFTRGRKFELYRQIDTLTDYLLVRQDVMRVEHFRRQADDVWQVSFLAQPGDFVDLKPVDCRLSLAEIYDKVKFAATDRPAS